MAIEETNAIMVRKLALWHTKTFRPMMTHDELEPIMATLGFISLPPFTPPTTPSSSWKEYVFRGGCCRNPPTEPPLPRPRLTFPRIDGLHVHTYRAFFDAVSFYLTAVDIADHFHVRAIPRNPALDRRFIFGKMIEEEGLIFYREGTLDLTAMNVWNDNTTTTTTTTATTTLSCLVPLADIMCKS